MGQLQSSFDVISVKEILKRIEERKFIMEAVHMFCVQGRCYYANIQPSDKINSCDPYIYVQ